jgi:hypothetical protein
MISLRSEDINFTRGFCIRITPILVFFALALGAGLRFSGLCDHTVDHNEIYVPGLRLPSEMSIPGPRLTFSTTITSTVAIECHPPGYYLLMLPWTKLFGTSPLALRFPSAIADIATILLIYLLGARLGLEKAGVLGSFLWATAGLPIYLAQEARMYPLVCFFGVLATILLIESYQGERSHQRLIIGTYVIAILAGLATSHFFWPILITHMLYVQFGPTPSKKSATPQAQWQLFVLALASPLLAIAVFQSGRPSYLSPNVWPSVLAYFRLLYVWYSGEVLTVTAWLSWVASFGCILLLIVGVLRTCQWTRTANQNTVVCPRWLLYGAALIATMSIEAFALITHYRQSEFTWLEPRNGAIVICGAIPLLAIAVDFIFRRGLIATWLQSCVGTPLGPIWLVVFLSIIPVCLLALISISIPLITGRTVSMFAPYLMLFISVGAVRLCQIRLLRGFAVVFLLSLNVAGFLEFRKQPHSPNDFKTFAAKVAPKVQIGDLWFTFRHWATSPIFYYLDPDRYTFVYRDYAHVLSLQPLARVWVLGLEGLPPPTRVTAPLNGYHRINRVEARGVYADLYVPVLNKLIEKVRTEEDSDIEFH